MRTVIDTTSDADTRELAERDLLVSTLTSLRIDQGVTQREIAEYLGVHPTVITAFENRVSPDFKFSTAQRYAEAVGYRLVVGAVLNVQAI